MNALLGAVSRSRLMFDLIVDRYSAWLPLGLVIFAVSTLALAVATKAVNTQIESQRDAVAQLRSAAQTKAGQAGPKAVQRSAAAAWELLPLAQRQNDDLKTLFQLARRRGLLVAQAEYGRPADVSASIDGLQLTLPLGGSYPQLRQFAEDALRAMPHLSIDQIGFERDAIAGANVAARMKLTLWYRAGSPT
jgi:hypothetical protein